MSAQDGRAMFELQLELHNRAVGLIPNISADDIFEVHQTLAAHQGDLESLVDGVRPDSSSSAMSH